MGVPGVDGMTVEEALPWLKEHKVKNRDINLCLDIRVDLPVVIVISRAGFGCDGKALRDRKTQFGHFREVCTLAAEQIAHARVTF